MSERVEEIRRFLDQEYMPDGQFWYHQALRDLLTALAQAERERDDEKIACDAFQRLATERGAEVERLKEQVSRWKMEAIDHGYRA